MLNNYYKLKIDGHDVKRFIKQLYDRGIYFEDIIFSSKSAYVKVDKINYQRLLKIKTIYKIKIINLYGLNKIKDIIYRYNIFFISIILGIFLLNLLCNMVFDIEIDTDNEELYQIISNELDKYGIKKYSFIKTYDNLESIIYKIISENKDNIEWMEIERIGTKYIVRVEERIIKLENDNCNNRNIIAKRDGLIISITSSHGEIKKTINDYVKKGDILISGIITKDDEEKARVCATGQVFAEVWYQVTVEVPYNYKETIYTNNYSKNISITLFNKRYSLFKDYNNFITEDISISNNIIPIKISLENNQEIILIDQIYTSEELDLKALELSKNKLISMLGENDEILLEKKLKTKAKDSTIEVVVFFKVKEDITAYEEIE